MENRVKYIKLSDTIIIHYGSRTETLHSSHIKYQEVLKAIESDKMSDIIDILEFENRKKIKKLLNFPK